MRYSKILSATTAKINTIYNDMLISSSGGGNSTISSINELNNTTSSIQKIIPKNYSDKLIEFKNYTLYNGTTKYELVNGFIENINTNNPDLIIYSGVSNLNLIDIALNSSTPSNITLDLIGQNIYGQFFSSFYQINTKVLNNSPGYPVFLNETSATSIYISVYYDSLLFRNADTLDTITPFGIVDAGIITENVSFRIQGKTSVWGLKFANYEYKSISFYERVELTNVVSVFKNPDGENLESTIAFFFDDLVPGTGAVYDDINPLILQQLTVGDVLPEDTQLTNIFTYNTY